MLWILLIITGALVTFLWYYYYYKPFRYWKKLGVEQVSSPMVLIGDFWPVMLGKMNISDLMNKFYYKNPTSRYGAIYHLTNPSLIIRDPKLIKQMLVKDFDHFRDHINIAPSEAQDGLWSQNLLALKGKKWSDMRSVISGAFTSSKLKFMYALISEVSEDYASYYSEKNTECVEVEMKDSFTRFTNNAIATTAFGIKVDSLRNPENEFYLMGKEASNFSGFKVVIRFFFTFLFPSISKKLGISFFSNRVTNFLYNLVDDTLKVREEQGIERPDLLHLLLQLKRHALDEETGVPGSDLIQVLEEQENKVKSQKPHIQITNKDIASQAMAFFVAGFETVALAMCFASYELAVNPNIQDKLRREIKETWEENDGKIPYDALLGMKYLNMVITESLRKWPPIPVLDRVCVKPYILNSTTPEEKTFTLLEKHVILIPTASIHHDRRYYPDPEKFDPERFSTVNKSKLCPYTYMPFGVGPRACVGYRLALLEIKSLLFHLLKNFEIVPIEKTAVPLKMKKTAMNVTVEGGFPLGLKRI